MLLDYLQYPFVYLYHRNRKFYPDKVVYTRANSALSIFISLVISMGAKIMFRQQLESDMLFFVFFCFALLMNGYLWINMSVRKMLRYRKLYRDPYRYVAYYIVGAACLLGFLYLLD
jgi:hypothetical protein